MPLRLHHDPVGGYRLIKTREGDTADEGVTAGLPLPGQADPYIIPIGTLRGDFTDEGIANVYMFTGHAWTLTSSTAQGAPGTKELQEWSDASVWPQDATVLYDNGDGTYSMWVANETVYPGYGPPAAPAWAAITTEGGGSGGGTDEVWINATAPTDPAIELWFDPDADSISPITQAEADLRYVNVTGDAMTGPLVFGGAGLRAVAYPNTLAIVSETDSTQANLQLTAAAHRIWASSSGNFMGLTTPGYIYYDAAAHIFRNPSGANLMVHDGSALSLTPGELRLGTSGYGKLKADAAGGYTALQSQGYLYYDATTHVLRKPDGSPMMTLDASGFLALNNGDLRLGAVRLSTYSNTGLNIDIGGTAGIACIWRRTSDYATLLTIDAVNGRLTTLGDIVAGGPVSLPADPTTAMQAATKQYVDGKVGGGGLPAGGVLGDILVKQSATDGNATWGFALPKLNLTSTVALTLAGTTHPLTLGTVAATNLGMYSTGIQARDNGAFGMLRLNYYGGTVAIGGTDAAQYPLALQLAESLHATSRRAFMKFGSAWEMGQDVTGTGNKDFFLYNGPNNRVALTVSADGATFQIFKRLQLGASGPTIDTDNTYLHMNSKGSIYYDASTHYWRTLNGAAASMTMDGTRLNAVRGITASYESPDYNWPNGHFLAYPTSSGNAQARLVLHSPGVAPQVAASAANGERVKIVNSALSGYAPIAASAFEVGSSVTFKRDVRPLHDVEPTVEYDPRSDVVLDIDVMSLQPVAYRPKVPALRIVPLEGDDEYTPERYQLLPEVGIFGHEGERERLGLIAEQVQTVLPSAVTHDIDGNCTGIDYAQVTVALLHHVQELTGRIAMLEALL